MAMPEIHRSEGELVPRARDGDREAFAALVRRERDRLVMAARAIVGQGSEAEDCAQDVLLNLSRSLNRFSYDPGKGKFRSYLKTMVINAIARKRRQERGPCELLGDEEDLRSEADPAGEATWEEEWQQYHVRRAMQRLMTTISERDRIAFVRYAMEGAPAEQVAREVGATVDLVYQIKSRTLRRLRELISQQVEEEG